MTHTHKHSFSLFLSYSNYNNINYCKDFAIESNEILSYTLNRETIASNVRLAIFF